MNQEQEQELQQQIDAILFAAGNKVETTEIARLCNMGHNLEEVEKAIAVLKQKYEQHPTLMLLQEGNAYKLQVREKYISVVKNIVTKTELTKTVMETLAVVAYKAPVLQSEIIRIRTNKAYDHLAELENAGYITRSVKGRTKLIKLTDKFFEYFDVPPDKVREKFRNVEELEKAVEEKEQEVHSLKQEHAALHEQKKIDEKKHKEHLQHEHARISEEIAQKEPRVNLEVYDTSQETQIVDSLEPFENTNIKVIKEKLGDLEVVDEDVIEDEISDDENAKGSNASEEKNKESEDENFSNKENDENNDKGLEETVDDQKNNSQTIKESEFSGEGLFAKNAPPDFEKMVDQRVEEIVYPGKARQKKEEDAEKGEDDEEAYQEREENLDEDENADDAK